MLPSCSQLFNSGDPCGIWHFHGINWPIKKRTKFIYPDKLILLYRFLVLQCVLPINDEEVVIGQYEGYKDDPTVPKDSNTPTFATMVLRIHNEIWEGHWNFLFLLKALKSWSSTNNFAQFMFQVFPLYWRQGSH